MGEVINLRCTLSESLRNIADCIDSGDVVAEEFTLVIGTDVYHCGCISDDEAAANAVFDLNVGLFKMMNAIFN